MADIQKHNITDTPTTVSPEKHAPATPGVSIQTRLIDTSWRVALPLLTFSLGGNWLDGVYDTKPLFVIIGLLSGSVVTFISVRQYIRREFSEEGKK